MTSRIGSIIGWICAVLVSAFTVFSAVMGILFSDDPAAMAMGERLGITGMELPLAIVKIIIVLLYLFPKTTTVGFVLMIGYFGGVLATNMTHGFTFAETVPVYVVFILLTVAAYFRSPELLARVKGKTM